MSTDTDKYDLEGERESRHSALEELARDERRPAVVLLSALVLAAIFFAFGIMVGRWTAQTSPQALPAANAPTQPPSTSNAGTPQQQPASATTTPTPVRPLDQERRFSLLIENITSNEAAQSLIKSLERMGYRDVRPRSRPSVADSQFSIVFGHYTREEAEAEARRLRASGGTRLKNVRVLENTDGSNP